MEATILVTTVYKSTFLLPEAEQKIIHLRASIPVSLAFDSTFRFLHNLVDNCI